MTLDHAVYPDLDVPPDDPPTLEDKADYVHRICSTFHFGIFLELENWRRFAQWKEVFDRLPLPHSPTPAAPITVGHLCSALHMV